MADVPLESPTTTATATVDTPSSSPTSTDSGTATLDIAGETAAAWKQAEAAGSPPAAPREIPPPAQPATQADGLAATPVPDGRLPLARHQAILKEARDKADREIADTRQKWAWAEKLNPQEAEAGANLLRWLNTDPEGALQFLQRQREQTAGPKLADDPQPEPDVVLADGSKFYSAEGAQKLLDWRERKLEERMNARVGPYLQKAALAELTAQQHAEAKQLLAYYHAKFPRFKELEPDIKALMLREPNLTPEHAHALVYADKGRAKDREEWEAERTGRLQLKGAASSIAPGTPRPLTPKADRDKSPKEIIREVMSASA